MYGTNKALLLLGNLSEFKQGLDMHMDNKNIQEYPELIWLFHTKKVQNWEEDHESGFKSISNY